MRGASVRHLQRVGHQAELLAAQVLHEHAGPQHSVLRRLLVGRLRCVRRSQW
jgi:hypothetical protein